MSRPPAKTFRGLIVWQKAYQFALNVYRFTDAYQPVKQQRPLRSAGLQHHSWRVASQEFPKNLCRPRALTRRSPTFSPGCYASAILNSVS